ncbi:Putative transposase [Stieleria maiorica]|uniref:Transposase n=1 Tax=Stieleria maiorica TaxID=2795974 RepID=A0A5B9M8N6_9BACT|nr:transposase [Stieleria maiorica]QEF96969.1 Putative transposase [Stieleria maiorica]
MSKSNHRRRNSQKSAALGEYFPEGLRQKLSEDLQLSGMAKRTIERNVEGVKFVEGFAQHILPSGFQKVRHYGWMSSNSAIGLDELQLLVWMHLGWVYWLASGHAPQSERLVSEPRCAHCGGDLHGDR